MRNILGLLALAALTASASAQTSFIFNGNTTGDPTFIRPDNLTNTGGVPRRTRYEATEFQVSANGVYTGELVAGFDPYLLIYADAFDPNQPNLNLIQGDRNYQGSFTVLPGSSTGAGPGNRAARIFAGEAPGINNETFVPAAGIVLQSNRKYIAVVTAFHAFDNALPTILIPAGAYTVGIGNGPGNVSAFQAVPEPATMAALGLGALALLKRRRISR